MPAESATFRVAVLAGLVALSASLGAWVYRHHNAPWKVSQRAFAAAVGAQGTKLNEILEVRSCDGAADRCVTCHLGIDGANPVELPRPFGGHGPGLTGHAARIIGCSACHGGAPRALDDRAHRLAGSAQRDPLMTEPHVQASCGRCHVPGSVAGTQRLAQGAQLYLGLGCALCHPVGTSGKGGLDYGPDIAAAGRRTPKELKISLFEPEADFKGSTMPSFRLALEPEPTATENLIIFLESLALGRASSCGERDPTQALAMAPCTTCHAGEAGAASGRLTHRCSFIVHRADELRCSRCHASELPPGSADCPVVLAHRSACSVCHDVRQGPGETR